MKSPRSIGACQGALKVFDRSHWVHGEGASTIRHTFLHLIKAASRGLKIAPGTAHPEVVPEWASAFSSAMPGTLIEHALRLANAVSCDLAIFLTRGADLGPGVSNLREWLYECWKIPRWPPRRSPEMLFLDFQKGLGGIAALAEEIDHGKLPGRVEAQCVALDTAGHLMKFAVIFGALGLRDDIEEMLLNPEMHEFCIKIFLAPFVQRLEERRPTFVRA